MKGTAESPLGRRADAKDGAEARQSRQSGQSGAGRVMTGTILAQLQEMADSQAPPSVRSMSALCPLCVHSMSALCPLYVRTSPLALTNCALSGCLNRSPTSAILPSFVASSRRPCRRSHTNARTHMLSYIYMPGRDAQY